MSHTALQCSCREGGEGGGGANPTNNNASILKEGDLGLGMASLHLLLVWIVNSQLLLVGREEPS